MGNALHCGHLDPYAIHMPTTSTHPDPPTIRQRFAAHRAHARWVSEKLAEIDTSTLGRLDRWLSS